MSAEHSGAGLLSELFDKAWVLVGIVFAWLMNRMSKVQDDTSEALSTTRDRITTLEAQHRECERVRDRTDQRLDTLDDKIDGAHSKLDTIIGQLTGRVDARS